MAHSPAETAKVHDDSIWVATSARGAGRAHLNNSVHMNEPTCPILLITYTQADNNPVVESYLSVDTTVLHIVDTNMYVRKTRYII